MGFPEYSDNDQSDLLHLTYDKILALTPQEVISNLIGQGILSNVWPTYSDYQAQDLFWRDKLCAYYEQNARYGLRSHYIDPLAGLILGCLPLSEWTGVSKETKGGKSIASDINAHIAQFKVNPRYLFSRVSQEVSLCPYSPYAELATVVGNTIREYFSSMNRNVRGGKSEAPRFGAVVAGNAAAGLPVAAGLTDYLYGVGARLNLPIELVDDLRSKGVVGERLLLMNLPTLILNDNVKADLLAQRGTVLWGFTDSERARDVRLNSVGLDSLTPDIKQQNGLAPVCPINAQLMNSLLPKLLELIMLTYIYWLMNLPRELFEAQLAKEHLWFIPGAEFINQFTISKD